MGNLKSSAEVATNLELLSFTVPPFIRTRWFEPEVREKWTPKLEKAQQAYRKLELESIKAGLRPCTTRNIPQHKLPEFTEELAEDGLYFQPIRKIADYEGVVSYHRNPQPDESWKYYGVVGSSMEALNEFIEASATGDAENGDSTADHKKIGELLGYPECCTEFLDQYFVKRGYTDPLWQIALNTSEDKVVENEKNLVTFRDIHPGMNILLRYKIIQLCPHVPCAFDCEESVQMVEDWKSLGLEQEIEGMEELLEVLSWPVKWSGGKGTATTTTPLFELQANSQSSYPGVEIRIESDSMPDEATPGLDFPHPAPKEKRDE